MKRTYIIPSVKVYATQMTTIIATSGGTMSVNSGDDDAVSISGALGREDDNASSSVWDSEW